MSDSNFSKEENILGAVKRVLTEVIKDTATEPGMKHPLSEATINGMRDCLVLISQREQELAAEAGRSMDKRPRFTDEPKPQGDVVVSIDSIGRKKE
ncbi:MAG: segregation and condensation protein A [Gammaproteobacteria bacterium]|nr:segregation and condensation protein A [Gammaproteobacteria bacterium]MCW8959033.1 segregation and condensation protein A [Gammaproteobacteria bacterium]MCW8973201.1 segregation and condensation protein A [Gammaproteobacteria bacterium]MCW8993946.1 segregation and condensation protein A [Gammaproteobacteria bacterium]MCW9088299.1 segregation and condensation protein A [Gammaproteobacteria bacterium]